MYLGRLSRLLLGRRQPRMYLGSQGSQRWYQCRQTWLVIPVTLTRRLSR